MRRQLRNAALAAALALTAAACGGLQEGGDQEPSGGGTQNVTVRLASNDFTEQLILGEIYKQALEKGGYTVDYKARLGARPVVAPALESGQIDMYIEYAGSALTNLAQKTGVTDDQQIYNDLKAYYATKGITPLNQAPMSNQNAFAVTQETAQQNSLATLTDLAKVSNDLVLGGPPDCAEYDTCLKGFTTTYGSEFKEFRPIAQGQLRYQALLQNDIQVVVAFTTDGIIARENLVLPQDDKGMFPPDHAVPVVRDEFLAQAGQGFTDLVNKVSAAITTEEITKLNAAVDIDRGDPDDVARDWLASKGL